MKNHFESTPVRIATFFFLLGILLMLIFAWRINAIREKMNETQQILKIGYEAQYTLRSLVQLLASEDKEKIERLLLVRPRRDEIINVLDRFEKIGKKRGLAVTLSSLEQPLDIATQFPAPVAKYRIEIDTTEADLPGLLRDIESLPHYIDITAINVEEPLQDVHIGPLPPRTSIDMLIFSQ